MSPSASVEREAALRRAFIAACDAELEALKPGNVHVQGEGHGMTVAQFRASARAAAGPLCRAGRSVGARIFEAVAATRNAVGCNTNLGIVLLAAPVIAAAEAAPPGGFFEALRASLAALTVADADAAFRAIARASPGGLGAVAEQDVHTAPTVTLRAAMALAAERDRIALQYVTDYADVFRIGVAELAAGASTGEIYMAFLAEFPDSHVARKFGPAIAATVRAEAAALASGTTIESSELLAFDRRLKARGINPGTSADLTVASLLVHAVGPIVDAGR